jgi:ubiquinone/menaquinone biosynthesis C-methylase UbiE
MEIRVSRMEQAKLDFVDGLMAYHSNQIGSSVFERFQKESAGKGEMPNTAIRQLVEPWPVYRFGTFFHRHNHKMMFQTILDILAKQSDDVREWLDTPDPNAIGRLELDPDLSVPSYYENVEIHTMPGSYHHEFAGIMYHWMIGPYLLHRDDNDGMGWALANGVPKRDYRDILDLGCSTGKSTLPYCDLYPRANVTGIDYAAPMLKFAHKLAEGRGKKVNYSQRNAENTGLADNSFDLIVAIWLFHEIPVKAMHNVVREAYRLLRPGGVFAFMESPPYQILNKINPLSEVVFDTVARDMVDPWIPQLLKLDRSKLLRDGGFQDAREETLPNSLTGWQSDESYYFGAFPWWMTIGEKRQGM